MKCSWSNWFINLDGQMSNLVLIRTLRDSKDVFVRKHLRKLSTLESVRNKDRMAIDPIIRLTRPGVIEVLQKVELVVHTIVPEKYRFWASNQQGVCKHPVAPSPGPIGNILTIDYDLSSSSSRLLKIRLHQPAEVSELQTGMRDARDVCFPNGVAYVAERGTGCCDLEGNVKLKPSSLRSRADLEQALLRYNFSTNGTVLMLRERPSVHLRKLKSKVRKNVKHIVNVQLSKPSVLCMASDDVLLVADDGLRVIHQVSLERDGVTIRCKSMRTLSNYPTHIESVESMTILESNV